MPKVALLSLLVFTGVSSFAQETAGDYLNAANKAYDQGKHDEARQLYTKAAALNNADAHYALAYNYVVTDQESRYHYTEAAKKGHREATESILEALFFRSASLTATNPQLAYDIYTEAKKQNPALTLFAEEDKIQTLQQCIEAGRFDAKEFISKYKITKEDTADYTYGVWELAEQASRGVRFGKPDPRLLLQLVCKGGAVPAEKMAAVNDAYTAWKNNEVITFNICDYPSGKSGLAYCAEKERRAYDKLYGAKLKRLNATLPPAAASLLKVTFRKANTFICNKTWLKEGDHMPDYNTAKTEATQKQSLAYLNLIDSVRKGFHPLYSKQNNDKALNDTYKLIMAGLAKKPIQVGTIELADYVLRTEQKSWITYRDSSARFFAKVNPAISEAAWKAYFTAVRVTELQQILKLVQAR